jgi:hypothetical protein
VVGDDGGDVTVLDIAAIAALIGWSLLEVIVIWAVNLLRREPV